jgi:hypothetical protein
MALLAQAKVDRVIDMEMTRAEHRRLSSIS